MDIFECIWEDGLTGLELKRVCWIWLAWINQIHTIKLFIIWYKYKIQFSTRNEPNCIIRDSNRIVRGSIQLKVELGAPVWGSCLQFDFNIQNDRPQICGVRIMWTRLFKVCPGKFEQFDEKLWNIFWTELWWWMSSFNIFGARNMWNLWCNW